MRRPHRTIDGWFPRPVDLAAFALVALAPFSVWRALGPPIVNGVLPTYVTPFADLSDLPALALLFVVGRQWWRERRSGSAPTSTALRFTWLPVALAGLGVATVPGALSPPLAAYAACRWLLAAAVGVALVRSAPPPRRLATVLLLALVPHAVVGLVQIFLQGPIGLPAEFAPRPADPGANVIGLASGPWLRAYGVTCHPNVLGAFLATSLILGLPLLDRPWARLPWWIAWAGLLATFSRGSVLAAVVLLAIAGAWLWGRRRAMRRALVACAVGAGVVAALFVAFLPAQVATRLEPLLARLPAGFDFLAAEIAPLERLSLAHRAVMTDVALRSIARHPLRGVGAGNFPVAMRDAGAPIAPDYVHNVPLLLAAEVGVLGSVFWVGTWLAAVIVLLTRWRTLSAWAVASLAAWCAIGMIGLFDHSRWSLQMGRFLTVLVLAMIDGTILNPGGTPAHR